MSRWGQQAKAFAAMAEPFLVAPSRESSGTRAALLLRLEDLSPHPAGVGATCPRCRGQVLRWHRSADAACLHCGFEPIQSRPQPYVFEPYQDAAATSRAAFLPERDHRNSAIVVRRVEPTVSADTCVKCGARPERLRVNRCHDCYLEYCAQLRMGVA